jgi:hypothetical protein
MKQQCKHSALGWVANKKLSMKLLLGSKLVIKLVLNYVSCNCNIFVLKF